MLIGLAYAPSCMDDRLTGFGFGWESIAALIIFTPLWLPLFLFSCFCMDHDHDGTEWIIYSGREAMGVDPTPNDCVGVSSWGRR